MTTDERKKTLNWPRAVNESSLLDQRLHAFMNYN